MDLYKLQTKEVDDNPKGILEEGILEEGILEEGILEEGIPKGILEKGILEKGILEKGILEEHNKKILKQKTVWGELNDFFTELWNLLQIDFYNSYLFLTENKNYLVCAIILAFLLQFVDINNLGISFEKICNKNTIKKESNMNINLKGGGGEQLTSYSANKASMHASDKENAKQKKADKAKQKLDKEKQDYIAEKTKKATKKGLSKSDTHAYLQKKGDKFQKQINKTALDETGLDMRRSKKSEQKAYEAEQKGIKRQESEAKANQKKISFFEQIKNKFGKGTEWGGQHGALGPVFGNLEKIFDSVKTVFYIITVILTIAGILSIPVLIFLIITYMVFKTMVSKFIIL
jgi:hypothetical protein